MKECPVCRACADDAAEQCPQDGTRLETTIAGPTLLDGTYELERRLGEGGMGIVYRGHHVDLHRPVAIKVLTDRHEGFADRFRLEAAALGRLKHPHIVDVMDFGVDEARAIAYLVMELLEGVTLAARCDGSGLPSRPEAVQILEKVAEGVDFAHEHGILHRDLKPANIFLVRSRAGTSIKILDFGLAQFVRPVEPDTSLPGAGVLPPSPPLHPNADATTMVMATDGPRSRHETHAGIIDLQSRERGVLMGTPAYMAPELFRSEPATTATDLYALGVIAYQIFTGSLPPASQSAQAAVPPPSAACRHIPRELDAPVLRLLESAASRRPASARDAIAAVAAADRAAGAREWRERERPRRTATAMAIALVTALGAALWATAPIERLERAAVDARFALATPRPPHPAILLVVLDDASVDADARPLSLRADEFGATLSRVFDAGARAVSVDLLLPRAWADSTPFAQLVARHADRLTLGAFSTETGTVLGPECLPPLAAELLGAERARSLFGFVNLDSDSDGITRRVRLNYPDAEGRLAATWAARAAVTAGVSLPPGRDRAAIDYTVDTNGFPRRSWQEVTRLAESAPETFRDRVVLVGGEFAGSGDDNRAIPGRGATSASGLVVQALALNTILQGFPIREASRAPAVAGAGLAGGLLAFLVLTKRRLIPASALGVAILAAYIAAAVAAFAAARTIWPVAGPTVSTILAAGAALVLRASFGRPPEGV